MSTVYQMFKVPFFTDINMFKYINAGIKVDCKIRHYFPNSLPAPKLLAVKSGLFFDAFRPVRNAGSKTVGGRADGIRLPII